MFLRNYHPEEHERALSLLLADIHRLEHAEEVSEALAPNPIATIVHVRDCLPRATTPNLRLTTAADH